MTSQVTPITGVWDTQRKAIVGSWASSLSKEQQDAARAAVLKASGTKLYELIPVEDWAAKQRGA